MNSLYFKIPHPFITKHGTPLVPVTKYGTPYLKKIPHVFITKRGTPLVLVTKHGTPYLKKIPHVFITKRGTPLALVTKHGTPYLKKIPFLFIMKNGTPLVPITKYGTPYMKKFHTHSLRNIELLLPLLLNMERLIWKSPTPIHYETQNPSWRNYEMSKALCHDLLFQNTEPLMPKSLFYKNSNPHVKTFKTKR